MNQYQVNHFNDTTEPSRAAVIGWGVVIGGAIYLGLRFILSF